MYAADLQVSGAGYNDKGEIHIHKCDSVDKARESIYRLLEVSSFNTEINYFWQFSESLRCLCLFKWTPIFAINL